MPSLPQEATTAGWHAGDVCKRNSLVDVGQITSRGNLKHERPNLYVFRLILQLMLAPPSYDFV